MQTIKRKKAFSSLEAILSIALFATIVTVFAEAISTGQQSTAYSGARMRASLIAEEGLEVVRNMRDAQFSNLVDGTYGLAITNNQWVFSGTSDLTDVFTRQIIISTIDANTKNVISTVNWQQNPGRTGTISLTTHITNWHYIADEAVYLGLLGTASWSGQGAANPNLVGLSLTNSAIFPITIDKMIVSWTKPIRNLKNIIIGGITVFDGSVSSGSLFNITDFTIQPGATVVMDMAKYDGNMKDSDFIVTFFMKDGTGTLTTTFHPLPN